MAMESLGPVEKHAAREGRMSLPLDDANLEAAIEIATLTLVTAQTPADRRKAWADLQRLTQQRSARQVEKMEREKGLL